MKMDIRDDPKIVNLIRSRDLAPKTAESYILHIKKYCDFQGMSPADLIKEAREDQINEPWMDDRRIKKRLMDYNEHIEHNYTYKTRILANGVIRTFYNEYEVQLPKIKIKQDLDDLAKEKKTTIPTIDHIREAVENSRSPKYRAMIILLATSGMAINELLHLTLQDYYEAIGYEKYNPYTLTELNDLVPENTVPKFTIFRRKTRINYTTFCTPEAMKYINEYLKKQYTNKPKPKNPKTKLFVPFQSYKNTTGIISRNSVSTYFRKLNEEMGWGKSGKFIFFHPHSLRKFFATTLTANRVPELYVHWFLGHKVSPVTDAYFKPTRLREEYLRIVPYLSIEKVKTRTLTDERLLEMEKQQKLSEVKIEKLEAIIESMVQKQINNE